MHRYFFKLFNWRFEKFISLQILWLFLFLKICEIYLMLYRLIWGTCLNFELFFIDSAIIGVFGCFLRVLDICYCVYAWNLVKFYIRFVRCLYLFFCMSFFKKINSLYLIICRLKMIRAQILIWMTFNIFKQILPIFILVININQIPIY